MLKKLSTLALGTLLGLGTLAYTGVNASAAALLPLSPTATGAVNAASDGIVKAEYEWKKKRNNGGDNRKYRKHRQNNDHWQYRKHRRGHGNRVYRNFPLIIGGGFAANQYYGDDYYGYDDSDYGYDGGGGLSSRHVRYCLNKYRSYNPRNNTWVAYSGRVRQCRSPYL